MEYTITMADICELAHELTCRDWEIYDYDEPMYTDFTNETYSARGQEVFDQYYKIITNTLKI